MTVETAHTETSAPIRIMPEVTSYSELISVIRDRVGALGVRYQDFDSLAGFPDGLSGKVFGPAQVKRLGIEKAFDALRCAGLRLRVEEDPEQIAKMQAWIEKKMIQPRQGNQARMNNHASAISSHLLSRAFGHILREARKKRWTKTSKKERSEHARMMAMARHRQKRKRRPTNDGASL